LDAASVLVKALEDDILMRMKIKVKVEADLGIGILSVLFPFS
jgi:hypothetical protein